jgi:hypothetical protein
MIGVIPVRPHTPSQLALGQLYRCLYCLHCVSVPVIKYPDCINMAVAQLVEALRYKQQGREIDSRWGSLGVFMDLIPPVT